jgi:hypothetical protein
VSKFAYFYINNKEDFTKELEYFDVIYSFKKKRKELICVIECNEEYTYKTIAVNFRQYINRIELSWGSCVYNGKTVINEAEIEINKILKGGEKNE